MKWALSRLGRERRTMAAMLGIYCRDQHAGRGTLCAECASLLDYAADRLQRCCFQEQKPTCARCPVHCYRPEKRERVRKVMCYAGPRMLWRHPVLALWHLLDDWLGPRPTQPPARTAGHHGLPR